MAELLYRLGKWSARRAWTVIGVWIAVLAVAGVGFAIGWKGLVNAFDIPGLPSTQVTDELAEKLPDFAGASGSITYRTTDGTELTASQRSAIEQTVEDLGSLDDVAKVVDPFTAEQQRADSEVKLAESQRQIDDGTAQLDAAQRQLDDGRAQVDAGIQQLQGAIAQAQAAGASDDEIAGYQAQLDALTAQQTQLDANQQAIDDKRKELQDGQAALDKGKALAAYADGIRVVSEDGSTAVVSIAFTVPLTSLPDTTKNAVLDYVAAHPIEGVEVGISTTISQTVPEIFGIGEAVGLLIAIIVLGIMLRALIGAAIPLVAALAGVGVGLMSSLSLSGVIQMALATPVLGLMLGLAVGIDYSLFIINRHRKQLLAGSEPRESIGLANGTSGNAVVFAGSTVVIALLALNVPGIPFLALMGDVGAVSVVAAVLIAITLTPAILGLVGERVLTKKERARAERMRAELPAGSGAVPTVQRVGPMPWWRAIVTAAASVAVLVVVALPSSAMRLGLPDGSVQPTGSTAKIADTITAEEFGEGMNGPLVVTATMDPSLDEAGLTSAELDVANAIDAAGDVAAIAPVGVSDDGTLAAFEVIPAEGPNSESTAALVTALRGMDPVDGTMRLGVAGQAAIDIDISDRLSAVMPIYLIVVIGLSLIIMIIVFRSLLLPIIATGGFVLSLYAAYGVVVAVFQWGWGKEIFGIHETGPILSFLPIMMIGVLFGLAMDYQLFLASGMREAYAHGATARSAVTRGFRAGRSVVIAAALIMVSVFGGFAFNEDSTIRSMGLGYAVGILFDAFVVRMLLMPALMHIIGRGAWWLPRWLDRIIPNVDVEGARLERRHHAV